MLKLRPFQKDALAALERPGHVICVAPTGAGKSLIYQRAALKPGRRTLLITPLIALGRQQHARLGTTGGLRARLGTGVPSEGPPAEREPGIWIVSPERLQSPSGRAHLKQWQPDFLVVDECHCLWEWGERFRPAFQKIPELLSEHRIASSLWLTATLPPAARSELRARLASKGPLTELGAFDLPPMLELRIARVPWVERTEALVGWLLQQREPGILFAPTRESAERLTRLIQATGRVPLAYHAGLSSEERRTLEARIARELPDVVVATSAFGMGMDYPRLQWAALWQAPPSLLALAQAIGRAGRDPGRASRALVLWDEDDFRLHEWSLRGSARQARQLIEVRDYLRQVRCRKIALRSYFESGIVPVNEPGLSAGAAALGADARTRAAGAVALGAEEDAGARVEAGAFAAGIAARDTEVREDAGAGAGAVLEGKRCGVCDFCGAIDAAEGITAGAGAAAGNLTDLSVDSTAGDAEVFSVQILRICWPFASVLKQVLKFFVSGINGA
jgi:ATP-dependent DNA helicase RecQ